MKQLIFNVFVLITVIPCFWVAFSTNIVHAAFSLLFTLFGIAGLFVLLGADFIGIVQVVIYIGGILVLIIFGVMMTQRAKMLPLSVQLPGRVLALALTGTIFGALVLVASKSLWPVASPLPEPAPTTAAIGNLLLGKYLIPFEVASLLLLAALVGAVLIVRRSIGGE
ncbi:MAG: NADH-quinone oxidoreductase subunit J [Deltaproteobacteria bacterium]|nr:NADH-quinone oxidoreductase subunit J [Deltaproteobacteria bacterium]MBW2070926.1 NADH-quinone oxidoreductase subunit J [Deltaproteobacteria bacterium]